MNIHEMEEVLKKKGLLTAHYNGVLKEYVTGTVIFKDGKWKNLKDVFGIYKDKNGKYIFFITDSERGIITFRYKLDSEEVACNTLLEFIALSERVYQSNLQAEYIEDTVSNGPKDKKTYDEEPFLSSSKVNQLILNTAIGNIKLPHSTSRPVIRKSGEGYVLAAFTFFYTKEDIQSGMIQRPMSWIQADLISGKRLAMYDCKEHDFSNADFETRYNIRSKDKYDTSPEYYQKAFAILDMVRKGIINEGKFYESEYRDYINRIIKNIPTSYQRFYFELSV